MSMWPTWFMPIREGTNQGAPHHGGEGGGSPPAFYSLVVPSPCRWLSNPPAFYSLGVPSPWLSHPSHRAHGCSSVVEASRLYCVSALAH